MTSSQPHQRIATCVIKCDTRSGRVTPVYNDSAVRHQAAYRVFIQVVGGNALYIEMLHRCVHSGSPDPQKRHRDTAHRAP